MSSVVRTTQTPYFSFHRSSTPMPYSVGNPILNCCGGSLRTFGNMKRPVAASAAAEAAENAPQASASQPRRVSSGDVSSASRVVAFAAAGAGVVGRAAAPPGDASVVVLPARSGIGAGAGRGAAAAAGRAACAAAAVVAVAVAAAAGAAAGAAGPGAGAGRAAGVVVCCGVTARFAPVGGALAVCPATGEPVVAAAPVASPVCGTIFGAAAPGSGFSAIKLLPLTLGAPSPPGPLPILRSVPLSVGRPGLTPGSLTVP